MDDKLASQTTDRYTEAELAAIREKRTAAHDAAKEVIRRAGITRDHRLLPTIARCTKCGREFASMPFDRIDHYAPPGSVRETRLSYRAPPSGDPVPCGGMVVEVERAGR